MVWTWRMPRLSRQVYDGNEAEPCKGIQSSFVMVPVVLGNCSGVGDGNCERVTGNAGRHFSSPIKK
jgi:hypothetical protein